MPEDISRTADGEGSRMQRGRPVGSISLTSEIQDTIAAFIRAGAFGHVAAEAAGVPARTFREWIQRGEGNHPDRPATPELVAFANEVRSARAQARIGAEIRVYKDRPALWLSYVARTKPDSEGWTHPKEEPLRPQVGQTLEDRLKEADAREKERARQTLSKCPPTCDCTYHRGGADEQEAINRYVQRRFGG